MHDIRIGDLYDAYGTNEIAQILHCDVRTVRRLIAEGELDCIRIGIGRGQYRITQRMLRDYLRRHHRGQPPS